MKQFRSASLLILALGMVHCTPDRIPELHKSQAEKCLSPGNPAYDMNLGEPKCPNKNLSDPSGS